MEKVSILVPVYKVEQYMERCSRSLFEQSYPNLEYVFVDDCSPDRSIEVLKRVMEDYPERKDAVRIVTHAVNRGVAATRNTSLDHSSGTFLFFLDSDDWLDTNAILSLVRKQSETDADMVWGRRLVHYSKGEAPLPEIDYKSQEQLVLQMMQRTWDHFVTGRLFRRRLFDDHQLRWVEGLDIGEDRYIMALLAYHAQGFTMADDLAYHYERRNDSALTSCRSAQKAFRNNRIELENVQLIEQYFLDKEPVYRQEAARCVLEQLQYNLQAAVAFKDRGEYYRVLETIHHHQGRKKGPCGWIKTRYGYQVMAWQKRRVARFIRKRYAEAVDGCRSGLSR